ncbi:transcriptional regulator BetI [Chromobacterium violaceum]|uniref:Transcriptional regulator BetI n=1 Tax=Chromobacterium violaceum TaxID=536 RepID=A0A3S4IIQ7_CHRVL|nr:transcriptional regulator BetI [Chromobacterium violaceum]
MQTRRTQQSRRESTIGKLVEAAIECLMESGYHGTSVQLICGRAGVSQGALFRHFATKNELMQPVGRKVVDDIFESALALAAQLPPGMSEEERIIALMKALVMSPRHIVLLELLMAARTTPDLRDIFLGSSSTYFRDRFVAMMASLFPRYAISTGFFATLLTMMTTMHGMALYRTLAEHPEGDRMREQWLLSALRAELERIRQEGRIPATRSTSCRSELFVF